MHKAVAKYTACISHGQRIFKALRGPSMKQNMNRAKLTADDYYGLATTYRKRAFAVINGEDRSSRIHASDLAIKAYQNCMEILLNSPEWGKITWEDMEEDGKHLASKYYLAHLLQNRAVETGPRDLWARTVTIHQSVRYYLDFIWILCQSQVPGLDSHLKLVNDALPHGYYGRFDVSKLVDTAMSSSTKQVIAVIIEDLKKKESVLKSIYMQGGFAAEKVETRTNPEADNKEPHFLLLLADRAIKGLIDCVDELSLYLCSLSKRGSKELEVLQGYIQLTEVPCPELLPGQEGQNQGDGYQPYLPVQFPENPEFFIFGSY